MGSQQQPQRSYGRKVFETGNGSNVANNTFPPPPCFANSYQFNRNFPPLLHLPATSQGFVGQISHSATCISSSNVGYTSTNIHTLSKRTLTTSSYSDAAGGSAGPAPLPQAKPGGDSDPIYISSEDSDTEKDSDLLKRVHGLSLAGREWENCAGPTANLDRAHSFDFSLMSYNILSQKLLFANSYLYGSCSLSDLEEKTRLQRIFSELETTKADIVCLQEVEAQLYFENWKSRFEALGYHCLYKKRTGDKPDGCAILLNSKKFDVIKSREIEYYSPNVNLLDRDNVAILALVEVKSKEASHVTSGKKGRFSDTPPRMIIGTTHLLFNHRRGDVKLAQLQYLFGEMDRLGFFGVDASASPHRLAVYYPMMLCGDFNLEPFSPLYNFITQGVLQYEGLPRASLSGQVSGVSGSGPRMSRALLPDWFGLADNSEFTDSCTVKNAVTSSVNFMSGSPISADANKDVTVPICSTVPAFSRKYYSGTASHPFPLRPVYNYETRSRGDFTSLTKGLFHAVDHMFYSGLRPQGEDLTRMEEGRLHLMRRLRVPNYEVVENGSIPHERPSLPFGSVPSDHVPLLAEFSLEMPQGW